MTTKYITYKKSRAVGICYNHVQNAEEACWEKYMLFGEAYNASKETMVRDMRVIADFLTEEEERSLFEEVEPYMRRLRYEFDHWDEVS
jgi:alkylated DNA repair protein alkB family protein 7